MKRIKTQDYRKKSIGNGKRTVSVTSKPKSRKRSIVSNVNNMNTTSQRSNTGQRSGCSGCSRSAGRK